MTDGRAVSAWRRLRSRAGWLDHLVRAGLRYDEADGGRLAAAVTYYSFFATFSLGLLGFAIFGFLLDDPAVLRSVERYFAENLPHVDLQTLRDARNTAGVIAFVGLPITAWFWADVLRSSVRKVWQLEEYPGNLVVRILVDLLVLAGLGILLAASLSVAYGTTAAANWLVAEVHPGATPARWLLATVGLVLALGVNTVLAAGMLTHRDHRGNGHGKAITLAAAAALRDMGASSATPASNGGAVATYASAGFRRMPAVTDFALLR